MRLLSKRLSSTNLPRVDIQPRFVRSAPCAETKAAPGIDIPPVTSEEMIRLLPSSFLTEPLTPVSLVTDRWQLPPTSACSTDGKYSEAGSQPSSSRSSQ